MSGEKKVTKTDGVAKGIAAVNETSSKGLINDLLGPSTKALGNFFGEKTEAHLDNRRRKNVSSHVKAVEDKHPGITIDVTPRIANHIEEWTKQASNVETEDIEAGMWRGILDQILHGNHDAQRMIQKAKDLSSDDLKFLSKVNNYRRDSDFDDWQETLVELERMGLATLSKTVSKQWRFVTIIFAVFIILILTFLTIRGIELNQKKLALFSEQYAPQWQLTVLLLLVIGCVSALYRLLSGRMPFLSLRLKALTKDGRYLQEAISKYENHDTSNKGHNVD